jgi:hypothetical protein
VWNIFGQYSRQCRLLWGLWKPRCPAVGESWALLVSWIRAWTSGMLRRGWVSESGVQHTRPSISVKSGSCPTSAAAATDKYSGSRCASSFTRTMMLVVLRGCKKCKDGLWEGKRRTLSLLTVSCLQCAWALQLALKVMGCNSNDMIWAANECVKQTKKEKRR